MAGIVDIKYNILTRLWTAKPRFAYDKESFENGAPQATGHTAAIAVYNLCDKLPEDMANQLRKYCPSRIYNSPESPMFTTGYKCIEVDGHCPNSDEWRSRRDEYILTHSN